MKTCAFTSCSRKYERLYTYASMERNVDSISMNLHLRKMCVLQPMAYL